LTTDVVPGPPSPRRALEPDAHPDGSAEWRRHLPLPGTINVRDVGGYPAGPARRTRWRTLLRSDALHLLDDAGRAVFAQIDLRTVVDLRQPSEVGRAPDAFGRLPVRTEHIPLYSSAAPNGLRAILFGAAGDAPDGGPDRRTITLRAVYDFLVDRCGPELASAVRALAAPGALPALVHCSAGKDRTGIVVAFALDIAGVADADIIADYALTGEYVNTHRPDALRQIAGSADLGGLAVNAELFTSPPEAIRGTLERVRAGYGSVRGYLTRHGASDAELDALAAALTTAL
jgi:protein-tyrosine phosphatase